MKRNLPVPEPAQVALLAERLREGGRRRHGGDLPVIHVAAGGCGGCAGELAILARPPFDAGVLGFPLTDDPRAARVLLASGSLARNAAGALRRCWEAMGEPRFLVALGDCASGAHVAEADGYALTPGGIRGALPVDLAIRGSPPAPEAILYGLLTLRAALGALAPPPPPAARSRRSVMQ